MDTPPTHAGLRAHATVFEHVAAARDELISSGFPPEDAALDAEILARHVLGWDRARLLVDGRNPVPLDFTNHYQSTIRRRLRHEPVAMITGHREFWDLDFLVTPATLVPRPETEIVVEEALRILTPEADAIILDVGTGSGCLAVALAHERPAARVIATDMSHAALLVARTNAQKHDVAERIWFVRTDLLAGLSVPADLIVSNPPYVPEQSASVLPRDVIDYEPASALFGGADGLAAIRQLFATAPANLAAGGRLVVEFGFGQEHAVRGIACESGWRIDRVVKDLQGIARTIVLGR